MPLIGRRTGALSSFGFGGTNAHAVLGESEVPVDFITLQRPPQSLGVLDGFFGVFWRFSQWIYPIYDGFKGFLGLFFGDV